MDWQILQGSNSSNNIGNKVMQTDPTSLEREQFKQELVDSVMGTMENLMSLIGEVIVEGPADGGHAYGALCDGMYYVANDHSINHPSL